MIVYIAGPYSEYKDGEGTLHGIDENIESAMKIAAEVWSVGHTAICPHGNTAHFERRCPSVDYQQYIDGDLDILRVCDAILMLPTCDHSKGALSELDAAKVLGIPVYYYPDIPPLHPTEVRCPNQVRAFRSLIGKMYRTHLKKNADYSPANIMGTGEIGVVTRLWDKTARLMNLVGLKIDINTPVEFVAPKKPNNESIDDTYGDLSVYAVIGQLLRAGDWGR